jgi:hypothetical protein
MFQPIDDNTYRVTGVPRDALTGRYIVLDPFPYVGEYGSRHAYPGTLNGKRLEFSPRDGYWQQESRYER